MRSMLVAFLVLPLAQTVASAQTAGDAAAGKAYWDRAAPRLTDCKDCHGLNGEGGFGPDLAGRGLNAAQIERAAHQPWGVMPAFVESQLSAKDAADLAAYFASRRREPTPVPSPADAIERGSRAAAQCVVCHGPRGQGDAAKGIPNLAGQAPGYLREQMLLFKQDRRSPGDPALAALKALLKTVPDETFGDLAAYYSSLR